MVAKLTRLPPVPYVASAAAATDTYLSESWYSFKSYDIVCAEFLQHLKDRHVDATIQVRDRGVLTLPAELREKYGIQPGDTFRLVDLDGVFVLTPMVPMVPELAREIERARREAGLTTDDLLRTLREQRERYHREHDDDAT
jgi:bifunctional DNA-binding transcriptional regulator/antitoxin component of YhaV-PrlF toxin-antitoxin module